MDSWQRFLANHYAFDPEQPRVPAGNPEGGEWTAFLSSASKSAHPQAGAHATPASAGSSDMLGRLNQLVNEPDEAGIHKVLQDLQGMSKTDLDALSSQFKIAGKATSKKHAIDRIGQVLATQLEMAAKVRQIMQR